MLFERAYTTAPWTKPAVASILTGRYPNSHGVTAIRSVLPDSVVTLAETLSEGGYRTASITSNGLLRAGSGFEQGFDLYDDEEALGHSHLSTPGVTERGIDFLEDTATSDEPFFLTALYFDPHYAYVPHPEFGFAAESAGRLDGSEPIGDLRSLQPALTAEEVGFLRDVYDEEIRYTDAGIGRLLDRLDELELARETLVLLTSDHGEEFMEHGWLGHTRNLYQGLVRVPLLIRPPGEPANVSRVERRVSTVSIAATVLDLAGIEPEEGLGASLRPLWEGRADEAEEGGTVFFEVDYQPLGDFDVEKRAQMRGLVTAGWKLIRDDTVERYELYDVENDPLEQSNRDGELPDLQRKWVEQLRLWTRFARGDKQAERQLREVGTQEREMLRDLGYVDR